MDIRDDKDSYEIDKISKNDEQRVTDDIEVLKLGKLGSKKHDDNIEKEYDERNRKGMSYYKDSDERYQVDKNNE